MNKRQYCQRCHYPQQVCVCDSIRALDLPVKLIILQHPDEAKHAKNTARLLRLCCENSEIIIGENSQDFVQLKRQCIEFPKHHWLIYPNASSQPIEKQHPLPVASLPQKLILIDATWRKAYKMWQLNPWLQSLPSWHFDQLPESRYAIRKSSLSYSLSTLEATAYALQQMYAIDTSPLYDALNAMQNNRQRYISAYHDKP
ncbi:tRNA-uridine aminocarboxypropyltransferase [Aliiglaciecola sp. LCG003]|uniref:tRNA-uridine aminocarboxypropyltransferase n=1 Tax=Aliiglaciecola sp. LCG003 TaxID=3053655 RepID=UPI0025729C6E|nr:tRNA-uridine aminocarboxypropyltransferase [Aliiglaciecola sp. LCG003]WJG09418.1 tRNA-uridine aminocarboxypropyltransferase [Aliiglaciecola sp. LCG003]